MKIKYIDKKFRRETLELIEECDSILDRYSSDGYDLTLRQLFYQLVTINIIPNTEKSYSRLGTIVNNARLAGLLSWEAIVDRGRGTRAHSYWESPSELLDSAANQYRIDKWSDQDVWVEVMCEKQALEGVLWNVCSKLDVPFSANKGYVSQSFLWRKAMEYQEKIELGKDVVIVYLGDHDPSGMDMDRDIEERLGIFLGNDMFHVCMDRVALNMKQVADYGIPHNPAKITDSRAKKYISEYGHSSWELDAIEPYELDRIVKKAVSKRINYEKWEESLEIERDGTVYLSTVALDAHARGK